VEDGGGTVHFSREGVVPMESYVSLSDLIAFTMVIIMVATITNRKDK
jgi:hypothetical protein